jgi:hypothetical protein
MKKLFILTILAFLLMGCTDRVPNGHKGMIRARGGMTGELLEPGRHTSWGYDVMTVISEAEFRKAEDLSVLIQEDNVNFKFTLVTRMTPILDVKGYSFFASKLGNKMQPTTIQGDNYLAINVQHIYDTYVKDIAINSARTVVSKYPIRQINNHRAEIDSKIAKMITERLSGLPIKVTMVVSSNYDFPDEIEKANELALKRKVDIETEKAEQALQLMKLDNRIKLAEKLKVVKRKEAEAEGTYMKTMGTYLNDKYLKLKSLENQAILFGNVGTGDKVITDGKSSVITGIK